jgi:hypothetical protein
MSRTNSRRVATGDQTSQLTPHINESTIQLEITLMLNGEIQTVRTPNEGRAATLGSAAEDHGAVLRFTQQLCGHKPTVESDVDPETSERYFVVTAPVSGSVDELVGVSDAWHRGLRSAVGELANQYRLSLHPNES